MIVIKLNSKSEKILEDILNSSNRDGIDYLKLIAELSKNGFGEKYNIAKIAKLLAIILELSAQEYAEQTGINNGVAPITILIDAIGDSSYFKNATNYWDILQSQCRQARY